MSFYDLDVGGKIVPDAYHGTDIVSARSIVANGFEVRQGRNPFFGPGVYFFQGSIDEAKIWAIPVARESGINAIGVIRSRIDMGQCFQVGTPETEPVLKRLISRLQRAGAKVGRGEVFALVVQELDPDTILGVNVKPNRGKIFDDKTDLYFGTQIIICVKKIASILDTDLCYEGVCNS